MEKTFANQTHFTRKIKLNLARDLQICLYSSPKDMFIDFRGRRRGEERERKAST